MAKSDVHDLSEYQRRRRFDATPEPSGAVRSASAPAAPRFVVQKHAASHLHYDFRLEHAGVLLSWAVPKGPSLNVGARRLAMRTEDHPLEYADFEGVIPEGEYGGGRVLVWDRGTWQTEGDPDAQLASGNLTFSLDGEKLRGRFHLVRTKAERGRERWLLFKGRDAGASDADVLTLRPESVLSHKTIEQIEGPTWHSNRKESPPDKPRRSVKRRSSRASAQAAQDEAADGGDVLPFVKRLRLGFPLTHLDKVLYPEQGLRKADLIAYYAAVAERMLPHVARRPLTLVRCPNGRGTQCFYQKHIQAGVPPAIQTIELAEAKRRRRYGYVRDAAGLVALAQLGVLEIHPWQCHVDRVERPDLFVFDLDPDEALPFDAVIETAIKLRDLLAELELVSFVKTTGGKGLHVVVPVRRSLSWEDHKVAAHAIVERLASEAPERYVTQMQKSARKGKIFLDYLRNARGATAVAPYSTRAREGAPVALPLAWDELTRGLSPARFGVAAVVERLHGGTPDPWSDFFAHKQGLSAAALRKLAVKRSRSAKK